MKDPGLMGRAATRPRASPAGHKPGATDDRLARWYDLLAGRWEESAKRKALDLLEVRPGERVLDVGCGTGRELAALAQRAGGQGTICGIDLSAGMLREARRRLIRQGLIERVALLRADAVSLPFASASFDVCLLCFSLELFPDVLLGTVVSEVRRVLRPRGRVCVVALSCAGGASPLRRVYRWWHERFPAVLDCRPILVQPMLEQAGFAVDACRPASVGGLPVEIVLARAEYPAVGCTAMVFRS